MKGLLYYTWALKIGHQIIYEIHCTFIFYHTFYIVFSLYTYVHEWIHAQTHTNTCPPHTDICINMHTHTLKHYYHHFRETDHVNVLKLLGQCVDTEPYLNVLELCPFVSMHVLQCMPSDSTSCVCVCVCARDLCDPCYSSSII